MNIMNTLDHFFGLVPRVRYITVFSNTETHRLSLKPRPNRPSVVIYALDERSRNETRMEGLGTRLHNVIGTQ